MIKKCHNNFCVALLMLAIAACQSNAGSTASTRTQHVYRCTPCGYDCDSTDYDQPGKCSKCQMPLAEKSTTVIQQIEPAQLCAIMENTDTSSVLLLDVRTTEEFNGTAPDKFGRLRNAVNIPVQELPNRLTELEVSKNKQIIVYCSHSHRSPAAAYILQQNGFHNVKNMLFGMSAWQQKVSSGSCNQMIYIQQ